MQGDSEWIQQRLGLLTASRFADLMAKTKTGPSASRKNLITRLTIERLTGCYMQTYQNDAMTRGIELEAEARKAYEDHQLVAVEQVDYIPHPDYWFVGCSPDGLVGTDGLVEIKSPSAEAKHYEALRYGSHAVEYKWQILGQLWVTGREWNDAVSYDPRFVGHELAIVRVYRDEKAITELEKECIAANEEIEAQLEWFRNRAA